jgi:hypothetical protein
MTFALWQPAYARVGLITIPVNGKRPAIRNWQRIGLRASSELANKASFAESSIGVVVGSRSGLTVLDIDSPDGRLLTRMLDQHGPTPVIVRSPNGGHHCWYRHHGEPRSIRFRGREEPVDLLGTNAFAVAPPSKNDRGQYEFLCGGLEDVPDLPVLKGLDALPTATKSIPSNPQKASDLGP